MQPDTNFSDWQYYLCFVYLKDFLFFPRKSNHLPPSFGFCLSATFRSVCYVAPTVIPYQMDLIQIVKITD